MLEADLGWIVGWKKDGFIGHEALRQQKAGGVTRKIVGFAMVDRAIARHGHLVMRGDEQVGYVTSGTQTPFLKKAIGMAYVPTDDDRAGHRARHRHPRPPRQGDRGGAAVLQEAEVADQGSGSGSGTRVYVSG